jgi:hypothetical protein
MTPLSLPSTGLVERAPARRRKREPQQRFGSQMPLRSRIASFTSGHRRIQVWPISPSAIGVRRTERLAIRETASQSPLAAFELLAPAPVSPRTAQVPGGPAELKTSPCVTRIGIDRPQRLGVARQGEDEGTDKAEGKSVFTMKSKSRGAVDPTVCQLRLDGDWLRIVPGSFYSDGEGGFACTAAYTPVEGRCELTGPLWAIEDLRRESRAEAANKTASSLRPIGLRSGRRPRHRRNP